MDSVQKFDYKSSPYHRLIKTGCAGDPGRGRIAALGLTRAGDVELVPNVARA